MTMPTNEQIEEQKVKAKAWIIRHKTKLLAAGCVILLIANHGIKKDMRAVKKENKQLKRDGATVVKDNLYLTEENNELRRDHDLHMQNEQGFLNVLHDVYQRNPQADMPPIMDRFFGPQKR